MYQAFKQVVRLQSTPAPQVSDTRLRVWHHQRLPGFVVVKSSDKSSIYINIRQSIFDLT